jgi:hypothetical protein
VRQGVAGAPPSGGAKSRRRGAVLGDSSVQRNRSPNSKKNQPSDRAFAAASFFVADLSVMATIAPQPDKEISNGDREG